MVQFTKNNSAINLEGHHNQNERVSILGNMNQISIGDSRCKVQILGNGNIINLIHSRIKLKIMGNGNNCNSIESELKLKIQGNANTFKSQFQIQPVQIHSCQGFGNQFPENIIDKFGADNSGSNNTNLNQILGINQANNTNRIKKPTFKNLLSEGNSTKSNPVNFIRSKEAMQNIIKSYDEPNQRMEIQQQNNNLFKVPFVNNKNLQRKIQEQQNIVQQQRRKAAEQVQRARKQAQRQVRRAEQQMRKVEQQARGQHIQQARQQQQQQRAAQIRRIQQNQRPIIIEQEEQDIFQIYQDNQRRNPRQHLMINHQPERIHPNQRMPQQEIMNPFNLLVRNNPINLFNNGRNSNHNLVRVNQNQNNQNRRQQFQLPDHGLQESQLQRLNTHFHSGPQQQCIICFLEISTNDEETFLHCFHAYHTFCIQSWLKKSSKCPVCNQNVRNNL